MLQPAAVNTQQHKKMDINPQLKIVPKNKSIVFPAAVLKKLFLSVTDSHP